MKKKLFLLVIAVMMTFTLTGCEDGKLYYDGYNHLNFKEVLEAEEFELENKDYKETDDQAIIYLFRGQGCGFCRKFINFLNSISTEYGKYFKVISFEVWNDAKNSELMSKVPLVTEVEARGVPYIIIGDKVFDGYAESYDEAIKEQIMKQYKDPSYDVFKELKKEESKFEGFSNTAVIIFSFAFVMLGTIICVVNSNKNKHEIMNAINEIRYVERKDNKKEEKHPYKEEKKNHKNEKNDD